MTDLKKDNEQIISVLENIFESNFDIISYNLANELHDLFKNDIKNTEKNVKEEISNFVKSRNEFKTLIVKVFSSFGDKLKDFDELIIKNKDFEISESIINKITDIIQDFSKRIYDFNLPIEDSLQSYLKDNLMPEKNIIEKIWLIKSKTKIKEEILNLIDNSTEEVVIIIPKLEDHLNMELFQDLHVDLKIKIASSDLEMNGLVQNFGQMHNLEFRNLENDNIIALKGDNNHVVIAITEEESQDLLNNCIGFGTNYKPLINIMAPIIGLSWDAAKPR